MAHSTSSREKRRPMVESDGLGDPLNSSEQMWPSASWTRASGRSYPPKSDFSDSFDSSAQEPPLHAQPAGGPVPCSSENREAAPLKPVRHFIPRSWKNFFQRWRHEPEPFLPLTYATPGARHSPPLSPLFDRRGASGDGSSSSGFQEPSWSSPSETNQEPAMSPPRSQQGQPPVPSYEEKLEAYHLKYSYMKSWPGLLRLMAGLELLFGGMVFACVCAYIQKDYQWNNLYGGNLLSDGLFGGGYGYNYYGPMTPFVLVVASLVWLVTVILLGLGVTMYYRTILLNSHWWPLTEFALNIIMFLLYMAAAIVYINDVNRGGLCYSLFASNPLIAAFCRVEGGQVAAIAFLFITTLLYLAGALVALKMWRHEMARKQREACEAPHNPALLQARPKRIVFQDEVEPSRRLPGQVTKQLAFSEQGEASGPLSCAIPTGHTPKPHIVPDYAVKYPAICYPEEREKYKAVFNDQYAEYKELHDEVQAALQKFKELDAMMTRLPRHTPSKEQSRVANVWKEYKKKKRDPAFLEKQERCDYLKKKLAHIKARIQEYDRAAKEGSMYF
ncbi:occludin/ELL domain-containing protein 1 [Emydura macquarii macquarii]|uniref:occludin/ELL domain-containing protein 1 n=1 Tax=Emydura macquarii macquarii TaxID=1129001 RepID=UPI003529F964